MVTITIAKARRKVKDERDWLVSSCGLAAANREFIRPHVAVWRMLSGGQADTCQK